MGISINRKRAIWGLLIAVTVFPQFVYAAEECVITAAGGDIKVSVDPSEITLGEDTSAQIHITLPDSCDNDCDQLRVYSSYGKIEGIQPIIGNQTTATYMPPKGYLPQVEVVAASVVTKTGIIWGYSTLRLNGQGQASIETGPFADATIKIDGVSFGPVRANRRGKAKIKIIVPPGTLKGIDEENNEVDLGVPPVPQTAVFVSRDEVGNEDTKPVSVMSVVFNSKGCLDEVTQIQLTATNGTISGLKKTTNGMFIGQYFPPKTGNGPVLIESRVPNQVIPAGKRSLTIVGGTTGLPFKDPKPVERKKEPKFVEDRLLVIIEKEKAPLFSSALKTGVVWNVGSTVSMDVAADTLVRLPFLNRKFGIGVDVAYWRTSDYLNLDAEQLEFSSILRILSVNGVVAFRQPLTRDLNWSLAFSAIVGFSMLDNEVQMDKTGVSGNFYHERGFYLNMGATGAIQRKLGFGELLLEIRYAMMDNKLSSADGNLLALMANVGYRVVWMR